MTALRIRLPALCSMLVVVACGAPAASSAPTAAPTAGAEQAAAAAPAEAAPAASGPIDPVVASPDVFKVILDGPRARVLEATWQPKQQDQMHGHPSLIAYAVTPIFGLAYGEDGESVSIRIAQGRVLQQAEVVAHAFQNRGKEVAKMILVELKPGQKKLKMPSDGVDAQVASPDVFELMAFDSTSRVLLASYKPGQKDNLHGHPAVIAYAVTDVQGKLAGEDGKGTELAMKAGTAMFMDPVEAHTFENTGSALAQLLLVEQRK